MRRRRPALAVVSLAAAALGALALPAAANAGDTPAPDAAVSDVSDVSDVSGTSAAADASGTSAAADASGVDQAADEAPIRVMPLGDSITFGIGPTINNGYRTALRDRLTEAGLNIDYVGSVRSGDSTDPDNEGHPGWTIEQISAQVDTWIANAQPDVILLQAGTNDMRASATVPTAPAALSTLLDQIETDAPEAQVFVAKVTGAGTTANRGMWKRRIDSYNARIPAIVSAEGPHFHLVDQTTVEGIDLTDIVHPNTFGYAKMAWNWYQALMPVLSPARKSWPTTDNPYAQTIADRCITQSSGDIATYGLGCRTWYLRPKTPGSPVRTWQLPIPTTKPVKVITRTDGKPTATTTRVKTLRWLQGY